MRYRIHPKTGDKISEIGLGSSFMFNAGQEAGGGYYEHRTISNKITIKKRSGF